MWVDFIFFLKKRKEKKSPSDESWLRDSHRNDVFFPKSDVMLALASGAKRYFF